MVHLRVEVVQRRRSSRGVPQHNSQDREVLQGGEPARLGVLLVLFLQVSRLCRSRLSHLFVMLSKQSASLLRAFIFRQVFPCSDHLFHGYFRVRSRKIVAGLPVRIFIFLCVSNCQFSVHNIRHGRPPPESVGALVGGTMSESLAIFS